MYLQLVLKGIITVAVESLQLLMFIRALLSFLAPDSDGVFASFVYTVTEFVVAPVRIFCDERGWFRNLPIDIPFMITFLMLWLMQLMIDLFG